MMTSDKSTTFLTVLHWPFLDTYPAIAAMAASGSIIISASAIYSSVRPPLSSFSPGCSVSTLPAAIFYKNS
jgi:hypothetical protein